MEIVPFEPAHLVLSVGIAVAINEFARRYDILPLPGYVRQLHVGGVDVNPLYQVGIGMCGYAAIEG